MATEIVHWCDYHLNDEGSPRVVATQLHTITLDRTEWSVEVCDDCWGKHFAQFVQLVEVIGTKVKASQATAKAPAAPGSTAAQGSRAHDDKVKRATARGMTTYQYDQATKVAGNGSMTCPRCDRPFSSRTGLAQHARVLHGAPSLLELFEPVDEVAADA